jgi:uncharacterized membrane protein/mono/diheme cytochrome c family protein
LCALPHSSRSEGESNQENKGDKNFFLPSPPSVQKIPHPELPQTGWTRSATARNFGDCSRNGEVLSPIARDCHAEAISLIINRMNIVASLAAAIFLLNAAFTSFAAQNDAQLTAAIRQIFQAKCAECHAPDSGKRKAIAKWADWRDLDELKRKYVAEDFSLEHSTLWDALIEENPKARMPPADAKGGSLTDAEMNIIKRWITSGAPIVDEPPNAGTRAVAADAETGRSRQSAPLQGADFAPPPKSESDFLTWLGRFHPVVVHFPIALLLLAAFGEIINRFRAGTWNANAARFSLWIAAVSAVVAAMLGWFAAESGSFSEKISGTPIVEIHRWLGILTTALAVVAAALCELNCRNETPRRKLLFRVALFAAAVLVGLTGHFGGLLTFGSGHFSW